MPCIFGRRSLVLPLGEAAIKEIPNEPALLDAMRSALGDSSGLYIFAGMRLGPDATSQQNQAAIDYYETYRIAAI